MSAIANNNVNNNNNIFHEIKRKLEELNSDIVVSDEMQRNPVYKRGISKDFIRRLLQCSNIDDKVTPGQLVWGATTIGPRNYLQFDMEKDPYSIAALTKKTTLSFVETCQLVNIVNKDNNKTGSKPYFDTANVFVSYGWHGAVVREQLESLLSSTEDTEDTYFWIDIFAVAQNQVSKLEKKHNGGDVSSFEEVIKKSKVTLLYWSPYDSPNPIARVWCLFEILLTLKKGNKLSVFFREKDMENLYVNEDDEKKAELKYQEIANQMRLTLDKLKSVDANATFQPDWRRIHVQIECTLSPESDFNDPFNTDCVIPPGSLIANVQEDEDWENMDDGTYIFEKYNLNFMWGEAKPEEEGNGTWFGGALGHRELDQMAKNAVEKALADKGIPVATAATLLFESSSDAIDEDMDKLYRPFEPSTYGICHSGGFIAVEVYEDDDDDDEEEEEEEEEEEDGEDNEEDGDEDGDEYDDEDNDDDDEKDDDHDDDDDEGEELVTILNIFNGQILKLVPFREFPLSRFLDLQYNNLVASSFNANNKYDVIKPEIIIWNMKTSEELGRLDCSTLDNDNDDAKAETKVDKKLSNNNKKMKFVNQLAFILPSSNDSSDNKTNKSKRKIVVLHDDDTLSVWNLDTRECLYSTEEPINCNESMIALHYDNNTKSILLIGEKEEEEEKKDIDATVAVKPSRYGIYDWDDSKQILAKKCIIHLAGPVERNIEDNGCHEHFGDAGKGELVCCYNPLDGDSTIGAIHIRLYNILQMIDGINNNTVDTMNISTISSIATDSCIESERKEIDVMAFASCPTFRWVGFGEFFGLKVYNIDTFELTLVVAKGDVTFDMKFFAIQADDAGEEIETEEELDFLQTLIDPMNEENDDSNIAAVDNAQQKRKVRSFLAAHDQRGTLSCWELPV